MTSPVMPTVRIELGISGATVDPLIWQIGDANRGKIGTAEIGPDDVWVDVSEWVRSWSFHRGASRGDGAGPIQYDAGTCTIVLNNGDRRFDPTNLSGPYVSGGATQLTPMVRVRATATWAGVAYRLFTMLTDKFIPDYTEPAWSTTTVYATDAFKVLNSYNRTAVGAVGASEDTGARISRILDSIDWPTDDRDIAVGESVVQATTLAGVALSELQQVAVSEQGDLYLDADGHVVFRNRHAMFTSARSATSQMTFGEAGAASGEVPYVNAPVNSSDDMTANLVTAIRIGGATQLATDPTSIVRYLTKSYSAPYDLWLTTDADVLQWTRAVLYQAKDPELRFEQVSLNLPRAGTGDIVWPLVLARELADRVTVTRRPPGGGTNTRDVFIRGIDMNSDGADWKVSFAFQSAARYQFWTIGDPILGVIGSNAIAY